MELNVTNRSKAFPQAGTGGVIPRRNLTEKSFRFSFQGIKPEYSSIAQSVERMTVNHDVVGSSPTGGVHNSNFLSKITVKNPNGFSD